MRQPQNAQTASILLAFALPNDRDSDPHGGAIHSVQTIRPESIQNPSIEEPNWLAALSADGWAVVLDAVPKDVLRNLAQEAHYLHETSAMSLAGIGRANDHTLTRSIRRDETLWMTRSSETQAAYLDHMERFRLLLNANLFLGLWSFEAHYSVYTPGGFYVRHVDAFKGARNRLVSTVLYLNEDWTSGDGGELAIFHSMDADKPVAKIAPEYGSMAIFLSEDIPHAVLPTNRTRYSIAGWYRLNDRGMAPTLQVPSALEASR